MYNPDALVPSTDGAPAAPDFCMKTPLSFLLAATLLAPTLTFANTVAAPIAARLVDLSERELAWQNELCRRMLVVARRETAPVRRASIREVA